MVCQETNTNIFQFREQPHVCQYIINCRSHYMFLTTLEYDSMEADH